MATKDFDVIEQQIKTNITCQLYLKLKNEMKVMLLTRKDSSKVSVALDIHIGNFSNPDNFPGLAYLCQRMITLGNDKYLEYKRFQKLLQNYGGQIHLMISSDHTTYYFYFYTREYCTIEYVLHRFCQLFTAKPLLKDSWIEKEIRMMDSKLETELLHDTTWFQYLERASVKRSHPYSKYGLCRKKILTEMSIKQIKYSLFEFMKFYSANIMTLCIVSDNVNEIQKIVNMFNEIPNRGIKIQEHFEDPFKHQVRTIWCISSKNIKQLRLSFLLPDMREEYWREAIDCISFFLKYNNKYSLLHTLKIKKWCSDISAIGYEEARGLNFFHIIITLLPKGFKHIDDIITLVFAYFNLFKAKYLTSKTNRTILKDVLYNIRMYRKFDGELSITQQKIIMIVNRMHYYSTIDDILNNKCKFEHIVSMIKMILDDYISPQTIRLYVIRDNLTSKTPEWDKAIYLEQKIPIFMINKWIEPPSSKLLLPNLEALLKQNNPQFCEKLPEVMNNIPFVQSWYAHTIPKLRTIQQQSNMFFHFISPHFYENPFNSMLNIIFIELIKNAIYEEKCFLKDRFQWKLKQTMYGILFVKDYLNSFAALEPTKQATTYLSYLLLEKSWPHDELLKASTYITIDEIQKFIQKIIESIYVKVLIYGELSKEEAYMFIVKYVENDVKAVNSIRVPGKLLSRRREIKLENNTHVLFEVESESDHNVSCTLVYYQVGKESMYLNSNLALIYHIILKRCPQYFNNIEYIDKICVMLCEGKIRGLIIAIESFTDPYVSQHHIQQFISHILSYIRQISEKDFEKYKIELITFNRRKSYNTDDILWVSTDNELYCSDEQKINKNHIKKIQQIQLATFYKENISDKNATLSIHMLPKCKDKLKKEDLSQSEKFFGEQNKLSKSNEADEPIYKSHFKKIDNILQFKQTQDFYDSYTECKQSEYLKKKNKFHPKHQKQLSIWKIVVSIFKK